MKFSKHFALLGAFLVVGTAVAGLVLAAGGDFSVLKAQAEFQVAPRAQIGFETNLADAEIKALLEEFNVTPEAAFMWTSGLTGTHRVYKPITMEQFLEQARSESIRSWEKGLQGHAVRANNFVNRHSEDEVAGSTDLTLQARSLLNIRAQLTRALGEATTGAPLIYGVEVAGSKEELDRLRADPAVKFSIDTSKNVDIKDAARRGLEPEQYRQYWMDPAVKEMDGRDLYRAIRQVAQAASGSK